ncbi:MAG: DUF1800 family protein [Dehalococcoidia bacterium]|nr:DUF1800 family protein [Dehalococcoidia bacterium]
MHHEQQPPASTAFLRRTGTRRAILAGGAAVAAAGAAGAAIAFGLSSNEARVQPGPGGGANNGGAGKQPNTPAAQALDIPIADPKRRAAHLLRRAGFGGTRAQIDEFAALSREEAADRLLNYSAVDNSALDSILAAANLNLVDNPRDLQRWWLLRMAFTARPLEERMTFIWHGLLTSQVSKIGGQRAKLMVIQNELFRANALPIYDTLVKAVSHDPAMLYYLDTVDSTRQHPNENYARELMELFTLGVGNYTEDDVRESARAFTGWRFSRPAKPPVDLNTLSREVRREVEHRLIDEWDPKFELDTRKHDYGQKTFLGKTGPWDGDDIVGIIMEQPAAGRFICRRLFMEFAHLGPDEETLDALLKVWNDSGHDIRAIVRAILVSDEFYSERSYRALVRSPIEFMIGAIRGLEIREIGQGSVNEKAYRGMDQVLFEPPNVAGWPGGAAWLSSSTFFARVNFLDQFLFGLKGRPVALPALASASTSEDLVDQALAIFVDGNVPAQSRDALYAHARTIADARERAATVTYLVLASPEYQLI